MSNVSEEYWGMPLKTFCMVMHLSQLSGFFIPGLGFVLPIAMWITNKDKHPDIDRHGKVVVNWLISVIIYAIICTILTLLLIGVLGFIVLGILGLVFTVIGAIKANDGILWPYPLSFHFIK